MLYNISSSPLYFVRSGFIYLRAGNLPFAGLIGYLWPITATSKIYTGDPYLGAYRFVLNADYSVPSDGPNYRWYGFPYVAYSAEGEAEPTTIWAE